MQYVYVLNKHGEPLMPCSPRKAPTTKVTGILAPPNEVHKWLADHGYTRTD